MRRLMEPLRSLAGLVALAALAGCAAGSGAVEPLPSPPSTSALAPTTTPPDHSGVALPAVAGATTTTAPALGPGSASLNGKVLGPDGEPAGGATVRVERMVGESAAGHDVPVAADGTWSLPGVLGGRYRVRAWRAPDLAVVVPAFVFAGAAEAVHVELRLERHIGITPKPAVAPARPLVGETTDLVVQVTSRSVDDSGIVRGVPIAGATMELAPGGGWTVRPPNPAVADSTGRARWEIVCGGPGAQPLRLVVNGTEQFQLALPACVEPPTPPTTPPPSAAGSTVARPAG